MMKNKSFYKDSIYNIIASLILTLAMQAFAYPILAKNFDAHVYGSILTIMGFINVLGVTIGSSLNNSRLLTHSDIEDNKKIGDYNVLLVSSLALSFLIVILVWGSNVNSYLYFALVFLISFRSYHTVSFRININYKKMLIVNSLGAFGYFVGALVLKYFNYWPIIFIVAEIFSLLYLMFSASTFREGIKVTNNFGIYTFQYVYLLLSNIVANAMQYMDRFLIFPILGSEIVSIYTTASFAGKTLGIVTAPISGVILTHTVKNRTLTRESFIKNCIINIFLVMSFYIILLFIGPTIVGYLYPTLISQALPYMPIANLAALALILGNLTQPTLLTYCHSKVNLRIQIIYLCSYLVFGFTGMNFGKLMGFCIGLLVANILRYVLMIDSIYSKLE